jgi:hypothetical protein
MQIIFLSGTKWMFVTATICTFLVWHKNFEPAQNILGPVKGQGIIVWKMFRRLKFCHTGICSYCYGVPFHNLIIL